MRRILLHPGFHKTGTSAIQHFLWVNRHVLRDAGLDIRLLRHLRPAARLAMRLSRNGDVTTLIDMADALETALGETGEASGLILSCEGLAGHLPGYKTVETYATAPISIGFVVAWLQERFPEAEITTILTTRAQADWLDSAWRHHLRGQRLTLSRSAFAKRYKPAARLHDVVREVAEALDPLPVRTLAFRDLTAHPLGPGAALVDMLWDLPAGLIPVPRGNTGPGADLAKAYLALNKSAKDDDTVAAEKARLAEEAGLTGWAAHPTAKAS